MTEKTYSPEETSHLRGERTLSDAELIKDGAKYAPDEEGALIVTDEQMEKISRERESESCPNAAAYVKLHKEIMLPAKEDSTIGGVGTAWITYYELYYIDTDGNIAFVKINYDQIASIPRGIDIVDKFSRFREELAQSGFSFEHRMPSYVANAINEYVEKARQDASKQKKEKFDF